MSVGVVVIGRNEGDRLKRCLASVMGAGPVAYVDSGSTDGSVAHARSVGAEVVTLDTAQSFTAARARNAGAARLREMGQGVRYIQFVDGDCEVDPTWIETAQAFLDANPKAAVACGRRRERFPEATIYNALCDWEWDTPLGQAAACGGDALIRAEAFAAVDGFNPSLIAGEEPDMCFRMREIDWEIWRLDADMTLHDAAMTRFGQFWKRAQRGGFARAEGMVLHGASPERYNVAETRRIVLWGVVLPLGIVLAALILGPWALALALIYPAQILRLARRDGRASGALARAWLLTVGKFAEAQGVLTYLWRRLRGGRAELIEYK